MELTRLRELIVGEVERVRPHFAAGSTIPPNGDTPRRAFLIFRAAFAWIFTMGVGAGTTRLDDFLRLSHRLVGRKSLDGKIAAIYLEALRVVPRNDALLSELSSGRGLSEAHLALERTIIEWWYTGIYEIGGERRVAAHTGALMWDAIGVPAASVCAGGSGAWANPPKKREA